jgi:molybdate transport system substrate-binding protein
MTIPGRLLASAFLVPFLAHGCAPATEQVTTAHRPLLAFAAASTRDAIHEIGADFTRETGVDVRISADDSSRLAQQIVQGAPADVFLSASEQWADLVKDRGLAAASTSLLTNSLVIVAPRGNPGGVHGPKDLARSAVGHVAVAGPTVPAGVYARQALRKLGLWDDVERKLVSGENVRVALAFVERGEAEAGIVYATDARISERIELVHAFDPQFHAPIRYSLVLLNGPHVHVAARRFYDYLQGPEAARVFQKYGFRSAPPVGK